MAECPRFLKELAAPQKDILRSLLQLIYFSRAAPKGPRFKAVGAGGGQGGCSKL